MGSCRRILRYGRGVYGAGCAIPTRPRSLGSIPTPARKLRSCLRRPPSITRVVPVPAMRFTHGSTAWRASRVSVGRPGLARRVPRGVAQLRRGCLYDAQERPDTQGGPVAHAANVPASLGPAAARGVAAARAPAPGSRVSVSRGDTARRFAHSEGDVGDCEEGGCASASQDRSCHAPHVCEPLDSAGGIARLRARPNGAQQHPSDGRYYGHLVPGGNRDAVARLDAPATSRNLSATEATAVAASGGGKSFVFSGEPGGNRTPNPQIKRTTGSRPPLSTGCFPFVIPETSLLDRPPVSTCGHPLVCRIVCQPAAVS